MTENQQVVKTMSQKEVGFVTSYKAMQADVNKTAHEKGWHDKRRELIYIINKFCDEESGMKEFATKAVISQMLALAHSELSEGLEGLRKDLDDDKIPEFSMLEAELADTIIRIMDLAQEFDLRVPEAIVAKARMNKGREHLHGNKAF